MLLALFVASGFAGLIYQAIWSHYLGLSLGHAAYAQTLVLAIFMGGMALGAWLVSRRGVRWRRLIFAYALVEIVIGLAGLAFHPLFIAYTGVSHDLVYPALSEPWAVRAWQWGSAALLIAPQSILLGMTFPLMSAGYLRVAPGADGEILGGLYFSNSVGAAFGALFATFVLLPSIGMPGAVAVAGIVNLAVGIAAWLVSRRGDVLLAAAPSEADPRPAERPVEASFYRMMLLAAGITGASSFVYEIGWVRMLNQALGTTIHSFELMLSAFILGLAFGGLWIRGRSRTITDPVAYAGYAQILMGLAALVSLPVFAQSFRWVGLLMDWVPRTDGGYSMFSLGSAVVALLVMFPAAFFAGMTLPLFTMSLLRRGAGESGIGRIYAANTLGAIVGVALAVHVLIPAMGLHLAVTLAALADIVLGFVLLRHYAEGVRPAAYLGALVTTMLVLGSSLVLGRADPQALASGVFRTGSATLDEASRVRFLRDGKTTTVAVYTQGAAATIATNGKPDAAMQLDLAVRPSDDEITMLMLGAMPLAVHPEPRRIAVIGWGSGLSTHTVLGSPVPEVVDSIEIERAMYDGAMLFGSRVARAYSDPRSHLHIDDARTYFSTGQRRYDVIVSEPSNPWVSGVASLFTRQFYGFLASHLEDDGILVQWVHTYELDDRLLATILSALSAEFPHIEVYRPNFGDLVLLASHRPIPPLSYPAAAGSDLQRELARVGLATAADFSAYRVGSQRLVENLVRLTGAEAHDDFYPTVSLQAPRSRFRGDSAKWLHALAESGLPVLELTDGRRPPRLSQGLTPGRDDAMVRLPTVALNVADALRTGDMSTVSKDYQGIAAQATLLRGLSLAPVSPGEVDSWLVAATTVAEFTLSHLPAEDQEGVWRAPAWYLADGQPDAVEAVQRAYAATAGREPGAMLESGRQALATLGLDRPLATREHMLVIAMLGAIGSGQPAEAMRLDREEGASIPVLPGSSYGFVRAYLLAWADGSLPQGGPGQ
ncbi:spermine synthase [Arenimonas terrae]|uniref:Spermine synthase n=1 Tax=Arenimonas terrae TaxID=2546226 RepID=A0A5C4RW19_9GAMM|nr:spermine synthase [Arenimonas terrae]TNJ35483.1 spermine synthase [Arenimonas terrae]